MNVSPGVAVVLGGYVNGYGIVRSLHEAGVRNICLVDDGKSATRWSRYVTDRKAWDGHRGTFLDILRSLAETHGYVVPFPTNDLHVELLAQHAAALRTFCYIPVNERNALKAQDKAEQYAAAHRAGVAVPRSVKVWDIEQVTSLDLDFPVLIRPVVRDLQVGAGFRTLVIANSEDLQRQRGQLSTAVGSGTQYLVSEIIPGGDSDIYAYTAFRSREGRILRSWGGRKLSQHPDSFGVYASASNEIAPDLLDAGRRMVDELDAFGIVEPEFKLDPRDGRLKLMEVNLRSMMWHRVGAIAGVNLPEAQMLDALGELVPMQSQSKTFVMHSYFGHEFGNLLARPAYLPIFRRNTLARCSREWAFWNRHDPGPFVKSLVMFSRLVVKSCLKRFS